MSAQPEASEVASLAAGEPDRTQRSGVPPATSAHEVFAGALRQKKLALAVLLASLASLIQEGLTNAFRHGKAADHPALLPDTIPPGVYRPRGTSSLQRLFRHYFPRITALDDGADRLDYPHNSIAAMGSRMLTIEDIRRAAIEAFAPFNPRRIVVFGSRATGTQDAESDVDLIVVYDTPKRFLDRLGELYTAWRLPGAVDILAYTPAEYDDLVTSRPFVRDVVASGTVLYERS